MTVLNNFKKYVPDCPNMQQLITEINAEFLISDEGVDWYESQKLFNPDFLKVVFEGDTGKILMATRDVTCIPTPHGLCVADVDYDSTVTIIDLHDKVYDVSTGTIVDKVFTEEEVKAQVESKIASLQKEVSALITPLQYANDLDVATEEEKAYLKNLKLYSVSLIRIPLQDGYPYNTVWPTLPTK